MRAEPQGERDSVCVCVCVCVCGKRAAYLKRINVLLSFKKGLLYSMLGNLKKLQGGPKVGLLLFV